MPDVEVLATSDSSSVLLRRIRRLLDAAFEGRYSDDDWAHTLGGWHVVVRDGGELVAHAAVVPRDLWVGQRHLRCGYVEGVATDPRRQREGFGSVAMVHVERVLRASFDVGALSTSRHWFYERLGWQRWRGPTWVREGSHLVRTPDEDDGVMVLRFGPSTHVDLSDSITCVNRAGDAW